MGTDRVKETTIRERLIPCPTCKQTGVTLKNRKRIKIAQTCKDCGGAGLVDPDYEAYWANVREIEEVK